ELAARPAASRISPLRRRDECLDSVLDHLGDPVEDLSAVVAGATCPSRLGIPGMAHRIAQILARCPGNSRHHLSPGVEGRVGATRLPAGELASYVQLVGLADVEPAHASPRISGHPSDS